jgi:putative selenate reductase molybdopterin-binding subunit
MRFDIRVFYTNNVVAGAYQGYGAPAGSFALQTAIAELAAELGIGYLEMIRKNHVHKGDRLEILKILGEGQEGIPQTISSCGITACLDRGVESLAGGKKTAPSKPWRKRGKGFAVVQQGSGLPGIDNTNAILKLIGNGSLILLSGGADLGTGLDTLCAKMVAEVLCLEYVKIAVLSGDTDATPFDKGAYASSGSFFTGFAAKKSAGPEAKILDTRRGS